MTTSTKKISVGILTTAGKRGPLVRGRIAVAGAGGSDFLAYLKSRIIGRAEEYVHSTPRTKLKLTEATQTIVEEEMSDFYARHWPLVANIEHHAIGEPSLIVAMQFGGSGQRGLWVTNGPTVRPILWGYAAVGSGRVWAEKALGDSMFVSEHAVSLAACYGVFAAKENAEYCGKDTLMLSLRKVVDSERPQAIADELAIRKAEKAFKRLDVVKDAMFWAAAAREGRTLGVDDVIAEARATLQGIDFYKGLFERAREVPFTPQGGTDPR